MSPQIPPAPHALRLGPSLCDISGDTVRSFCSILLNLGLLLASLEAPFLHTHQHEATQRHPGAFFHLHVRSAHAVSTGREFRTLDPDEDALYQAWFSATPTNSV